MKPITSIIVFLSLMIPSLFLSYGNYTTARQHIIEDVNQALAQTILYNTSEQITADTLKVFKSKLKIEALKETSYLSMCTNEPSKISFCSDTMSYKYGDERLHVRAYPNCSKATVFSISDQTTPGCMFFISLTWGLFSLAYFYRKNNSENQYEQEIPSIRFGNLSYSEARSMFYNDRHEAIYFTPMQCAFMKLLITSENKMLSIDDICVRLWPGKQNAKESLYTLVRRLKPIVENSCNMQIVSHKGGYYSLTGKTPE